MLDWDIRCLLISPGEWGPQRALTSDWSEEGDGQYSLLTLRHFGGEDVHRFRLMGLTDALLSFAPDVIYVVQQEPSSLVAREMADEFSGEYSENSEEIQTESSSDCMSAVYVVKTSGKKGSL